MTDSNADIVATAQWVWNLRLALRQIEKLRQNGDPTGKLKKTAEEICELLREYDN